jgi:hypothetical protein
MPFGLAFLATIFKASVCEDAFGNSLLVEFEGLNRMRLLGMSLPYQISIVKVLK